MVPDRAPSSLAVHLRSLAASNALRHDVEYQVSLVQQVRDVRPGQAVVDVPPFLTCLHEPTIAETRQVSTSIAGTQASGDGHVPSRQLSSTQCLKDRQAGGIGQAVEKTRAKREVSGCDRLHHTKNDTLFVDHRGYPTTSTRQELPYTTSRFLVLVRMCSLLRGF